MAVAAAALNGATALWSRSTARRAMGTRLMAAALGLYGLTNAHHTAMHAAVLLGAPFPAYALYFGFLSLAVVAVFALGAVVSLLEEERDLLLLSEQKAAKLFRNSPDAIAVTLPFEGGRIVDVNERFEEVTGVRREEALGRTTVELGIFPDEDAQRAMVADAEAIGVFRDKELTFVTRSGERRTFSIAAETFEWQGAIHAVVIARDITERLAVQEQLRRARVMEALGSLVAGVAHEARNPLFAISALVDAMQAGDPAGRDFSAHAAQLKSQVERLSRLTRDLLDYGRPSALRLGPVAVEAVARRAVSTLEALAAERGVCVELACEEALPRVEADGVRLEQVFENLIANAIQHSPAGSTVRVRIGRDEDRTPASLRCAVEDDGPGIPEEDAGRLFEPFYTARPGGTGLGLPIAQRVVEAHGGSITASTRPSGGACFAVWLPLPVPAGEAGKAPARP
jgi:PAS domain S-box-containing protein